MTDNEFYGQEIRRDNLRLMTENDTLRAELAEAKTQLAAALAGTAKECEGCKAATEKIAKARAEIDALHSGLGDMYDAAIDNAVSTFDEVFALAPEHTPEVPRLSMTREEMDKFLEENHKRIEQWPNSMVQEGDAP